MLLTRHINICETSTATQEWNLETFTKKHYLRLSWSKQNELVKFKSIFLFFFSWRAVSLPGSLRAVYLCNQLPEGVRGMLNLYEPDSLTSQQKLMQTQNTSQLSTKLYFTLDFLFPGRQSMYERESVWGDSVSVRGERQILSLRFWAVSIQFEISMLVAYISSTLPPSSWLPLSVKSSRSLIWK